MNSSSEELLSPKQLLRDKNLRIVFGVTMMVVLGVASVAPAFPKLIAAFADVTQENIGLVVTLFTLPGALLTPVMGVLADRYGRKQVLAPSLALFGLAGLACAFAPSYDSLLWLRVVQGFGAAALGALNVTIIGDLYPGRTRTLAMGLNAGVISVSVAFYPLVGGLLGELSWRLPFMLPVLALPLAWLVLAKLETPTPDTRREGLKHYLRSTWAGIQDRRVLGIFLATFTAFVVVYGPFLTYMPVHLSEAFKGGPSVIGAIMASAALVTAIVAAQLGKLAQRYGEKRLLLISFPFYALGSAGMAWMPGPYWFFFPVLFLGLAQGLSLPGSTSLLAELAPMEKRGAFMAVNGTVLRLGQTASPIAMAFAFSIGGMNGVFYAGAAIAVVVGLLLPRLMRDEV